jgi:hypothetical protein
MVEIKTRSKFERLVVDNTPSLKPEQWEAITLPVSIPTTYTPDVVVKHQDGVRLIELKGSFIRRQAALKLRHLVLPPDHDLIVLYPHGSSRVEGTKMSIPEWCSKYGIKCVAFEPETGIPKYLLEEETWKHICLQG